MELLERIAKTIPEDVYPKALQAVKEMNSMSMEYTNNSYDQIHKKLKTIEKRINALYEDKIDGRISLEFWEEKIEHGKMKKNKLVIQLQSISKTNDTLPIKF